MYIVDVIPITNGMTKEKLSYFSAKKFSTGSVVNVPLRKKKISALIVDIKEAKNEKSNLRSSDFKIRKVSSRTAKKIVTPAFVRAAHNCSRFFACSTGEVLSALTPTALIKEPTKLSKPHQGKEIETTNQLFVIQGDNNERYANYKSQIRESFARGKSVLFILPTLREIENCSDVFKKGIEHFTYTLHSSMKKKDLLNAWNEIAESEHPVLVIATGTFLGIPRNDIGTIIIEHETHHAYKQIARPHIDIRIASELYAKELGAHVIFGDTIVRSETVWREKEGLATALSTMKFRTSSSTEIDILDMRSQTEKKTFALFAPETIELIKYTLNHTGRLFLFTTRKGISSTTICGDCGTTITCDTCSSPVVLHESQAGNIFICHKCNAHKNTDDICAVCGGWNLQSLGIGIERIMDELISLGATEESLYRIDSDTTKTHLQASQEMKAFLSSHRSILVGTTMALNYLPDGLNDLSEKIDHATIISLDSLFSIPDFKMNEHILHIITQLKLRIQGHLLIQTRLPNQSIFDYSVKGNLLDFFKEELAERKQFNYPPFTRFVKISLWGTKQRVIKRMEEVKEYLHNYSPAVYPAFTDTIRGKYGMHLLLKIPRDAYPDPHLTELLKALPREYDIDVEPVSII